MVSTQDNNIYVWDPVKLRKYRQFSNHTNWVRSVTCKTYEDSYNGVKQKVGILISAGDDCTIRFYNIMKGQCLRIFQNHKSGIIFLEIQDD